MRYFLLLVLMPVSLSLAESGADHNHSHGDNTAAHKAHQHGVAELTLALEGNAIEISLESPAANIVGFEHQTKTEKQVAAVARARGVLESPETLFVFSGGDCKVAGTEVDFSSVLAAAHDEHNAHDNHEHERRKPDSHSDVTAEYQYHCSKGDEVSTIAVNLGSQFPALQTLKVMWLTEKRQGAAELTVNSNTIRIR